jgi:hypothetical protein
MLLKELLSVLDTFKVSTNNLENVLACGHL